MSHHVIIMEGEGEYKWIWETVCLAYMSNLIQLSEVLTYPVVSPPLKKWPMQPWDALQSDGAIVHLIPLTH